MVSFSDSSPVRDPDAQLMLQVGAGSHEAFNELMKRYQERVTAIIAYLMGDATHAEDLAQEVFLRVFRARKSYVVGAKFSTWLFTIVNNVVSNARRSLARRREVSLNASDAFRHHPLETLAIASARHAPEPVAERTETCEVVQGCINRLGQRQRAAVVLCDVQGHSYARVARAIGTSPDAAKSLIHRGRCSLKRMLEAQVQRGNV